MSNPILEASLLLSFPTLGVTLLGKTIGGLIGGFIDGVQDGVEIANVLNAINRFAPNKINTSVASISGGTLNALISGINHLFICLPDNAMRSLSCTPGHVAYMAECGSAAERTKYTLVDPAPIESSSLVETFKIL